MSREGISENIKLIVEKLCEELFEPFLKKEAL